MSWGCTQLTQYIFDLFVWVLTSRLCKGIFITGIVDIDCPSVQQPNRHVQPGSMLVSTSPRDTFSYGLRKVYAFHRSKHSFHFSSQWYG